MRTKNTVALSAAIIVVLAVGGIFATMEFDRDSSASVSSKRAVEGRANEDSTSENLAFSEALAEVGRGESSYGPAGKAAIDFSIHPFPDVPRSREGMPLESDPFGAHDEAEQAWLDRNGYPNEVQWKVYKAASDTLLAAAAEAGDPVAKTMLASRRLMAGDMSAVEDMLTAGAHGSGFALEMLSAFMAGSSSHGDPITGYALSRVAEMRGNYRLALGRSIMFPEPLTPIQKIRAEAEALKIFQALNDIHSKSGKGEDPIDPRPLGS